jgi:hypothetical protein
MNAPAGFGRTGYAAPPRSGGKGKGRFLRRFYLKPDESAVLTIQDCDGHDADKNPIPDGGPFGVWEYEIWHNKRPHYITCPKNIAPGILGKRDPFEAEFKEKCLRWNAYMTAVDETLQEWKDEDGNEHTRQFQVVLLPVTGKQLPEFKIYDRNQRGLAGTRWEVTRTSKDAFRIGNVWSFVEKFDEFNRDKVLTPVDYYKDKIKDEWLPRVWIPESEDRPKPEEHPRVSIEEYLVPFDYEQIFQPPTAAECCELLEKFEADVPDWLAEEAAKEAGESGDASEGEGDYGVEDDIPFSSPS